MKESDRRFVLRYRNGADVYALTREGEDWEESFQELCQVFRFAAERVRQTATLIVCDDAGKILLQCEVDPKEEAAHA